MGRTVIAYSMVIERIIDRFKNHRKGLRADDREVFDELMRTAKKQVQAGVMAQHPNGFDAMSMAMHISILKRLKRLEAKVDRLLEKEVKASL